MKFIAATLTLLMFLLTVCLFAIPLFVIGGVASVIEMAAKVGESLLDVYRKHYP